MGASLGPWRLPPHFPAMPRYFFNVRNIDPSIDDLGEELPDNEAAWHEATRFAGELFKDIDGRFRPGESWSLEVTDKDGRPIFRIQVQSQNVT
jgi:hypothetical protein